MSAVARCIVCAMAVGQAALLPACTVSTDDDWRTGVTVAVRWDDAQSRRVIVRTERDGLRASTLGLSFVSWGRGSALMIGKVEAELDAPSERESPKLAAADPR
jgi:hypothetical protein